jgi:hypothetical protein
MSATEIIEALVAAGCSVHFLDGNKASIVGPVPDGVLPHIQANRDEFIEAWRRYQEHRYGSPPPNCLPMRAEAPKWRVDVYRRVSKYVMNQPDTVAQWVFWRANEYKGARVGWNDEACAKAALADILHWQLEHHTDPVGLLKTLDEVASNL